MTPYSAPLEGRRDLLRLDFNENTIGPSPKVLNAIKKITSEQISIYPEYLGLQKAVVNNLNSPYFVSLLKPNQIGLFNGVDSAIHSIFYAYGDRNKQYLTTLPTFGYYKPCASMQGMKAIEISYEGSDFKFPLQAIRNSLIKLKPTILIICNPNNPTGTTLSATKILELAHLSPKTLVVVDELYEAFLGDSVLPVVDFRKTPNLVVLRSLSKTSGLAGLRIGFAIGHPGVIDRITRVTGPYDINSFAVTAAFAALTDQEYVDNYVAEVLQARIWIQKRLCANKVRHHMDAGNYFLLWPTHQSHNDVETSLKSAGILVRNMKNKPLIHGSLRVSIGTTLQMKSFWETYKNVDKFKALN
ncbi:Histidinol-phosphate aminotransferase [Prochlorococcus sp. SS52]|nr:Histidinol-phosphate aminotransferase [Prochlorococcus sp. SS52]